MLGTFILCLREGLEASLIVGIIAAFLKQQGETKALRQVWIGVTAAALLCFGVGVVLTAINQALPQREQEGLETVVGTVAVGMVTYMIIWMRKNVRGLKSELQSAAASALASGSSQALVVMAFISVLREGLETAVFLLAAFNESANPASSGTGAVLGLLTAIVLGYLIYRGGVSINLARLFRVTGFLLVLVAAGLLSTAAHTAHEANWLHAGQAQAIDLTWLVRPGTPISSLVTGILGLQPKPVVAEVLVYLVYLIPMTLFVLWPQSKGPSRTAAAPRATAAA